MDSEEVTGYACNECGTLYLDEEEATECHGSADPVQAFTCGRCGTLYATKEEAEKCCS